MPTLNHPSQAAPIVWAAYHLFFLDIPAARFTYAEDKIKALDLGAPQWGGGSGTHYESEIGGQPPVKYDLLLDHFLAEDVTDWLVAQGYGDLDIRWAVMQVPLDEQTEDTVIRVAIPKTSPTAAIHLKMRFQDRIVQESEDV